MYADNASSVVSIIANPYLGTFLKLSGGYIAL